MTSIESPHSATYLAFCRVHDKHPATALSELPAGAFGRWLSARWTEFDRSRGLEVTPDRTDAERAAFDRWLRLRTAVASYTLGETTFTARFDPDDAPMVQVTISGEDGNDMIDLAWDGERLIANPRAISPIEADEVAVLEGLAAGLRGVA